MKASWLEFTYSFIWEISNIFIEKSANAEQMYCLKLIINVWKGEYKIYKGQYAHQCFYKINKIANYI